MIEIIGWLFYAVAVWYFLSGFFNMIAILKGNMPFKIEVPVIAFVAGFSLIFFLVSDISKLHLIWMIPSITLITIILRKLFNKDLKNEIPMRQVAEMKKFINAYNKAVRSNPEDTAAYYNRGVAQAKSGNYKKAIADSTKAIELKPDYAMAYINRGFSYDELENYQQAIKDYTKAIELKPDLAEAYNLRGIVYARLGNEQRAIGDCSKAVELKPDLAEAYYIRGSAYSILGNEQQAIADFKIAARFGDKQAQDVLIKQGIQWAE